MNGLLLSFLLLASGAHAQQAYSHTCHFTSGPRAGQYQTYPPQLAQPVGTPCWDGNQYDPSRGVAEDLPKKQEEQKQQAGGGPLSFPMKGHWAVVEPPCDVRFGHHCPIPAQYYAVDLVTVAMLPNGRLTHTDCTGQPVYSPTAGVVESTMDGIPNNTQGNNPAGNHVVIKRGPGEFVVIAHFLPYTLRVKKGDTVAAGQYLAQAGNTGQSTGAHVHIHMQATPNIMDNYAQGKPMVYATVGVLTPSGCQPVYNLPAPYGQVICQP